MARNGLANFIIGTFFLIVNFTLRLVSATMLVQGHHMNVFLVVATK